MKKIPLMLAHIKYGRNVTFKNKEITLQNLVCLLAIYVCLFVERTTISAVVSANNGLALPNLPKYKSLIGMIVED